jgi:hypothetical protein
LIKEYLKWIWSSVSKSALNGIKNASQVDMYGKLRPTKKNDIIMSIYVTLSVLLKLVDFFDTETVVCRIRFDSVIPGASKSKALVSSNSISFKFFGSLVGPLV